MIHVQTKLFSEQSLSKTVMSWLIMAIACRAVSFNIKRQISSFSSSCCADVSAHAIQAISLVTVDYTALASPLIEVWWSEYEPL